MYEINRTENKIVDYEVFFFLVFVSSTWHIKHVLGRFVRSFNTDGRKLRKYADIG